MTELAAAPHVGTALALWRLSRPRFAFWLLFILLIGYGFAHWDRALAPVRPGALALVLLAWYFGNTGTMWLNAAIDPDEGGALFLHNVRRPKHLRLWGYGAFVVSSSLVLLADRRVCVAAVLAGVLSIAYSHPLTLWKGHPILGPFVNAVGYGALSMGAGWLLVGVAMNVRTALTFALVILWMLGATFIAQAFQREDDGKRGYRTLVVTHGPAACLRAGRACMNGAIAGVAVLMIAGYFPRIGLLGIPVFLVADAWMRRWQREPDGGSSAWAGGYVKRMLVGGIAVFALMVVDYARDYAAGTDAAGLATAAGRPGA